ncbi:MAG: hypothetical protein ABJC62_07275 [Frankiaceae bacterium]
MAGSSPVKKSSGAYRRARSAAARDAQRRSERRRRRLLVLGGAVVAVAIVTVLVVVTVATRPKKAPSFAVPKNPVAAITAAGLPVLTTEGEVLHIHAHLDVFVDGRRVAVPKDLGIAGSTGISPLHTHENDAIIHVESPVKKDFTLGQFFRQWQVPLSARCLGGECNGVAVYVNGKQVPGDPAAIVLREHQQISVVAGKKPSKIPSSYPFPAGL